MPLRGAGWRWLRWLRWLSTTASKAGRQSCVRMGSGWWTLDRDTSEMRRRRRRRRRTRPGRRRRPLCSLLIRHATRERQEKKRPQGSSPSLHCLIHVPSSHRCTKCYYSTTCMHTARSAPVGSMSARKPHQRLAGQAAVTPATLRTTNPIPAFWTPQQGTTRRRMQGAISHPARVCEAPIAVGCADAIHEPCSRSADGGARRAAFAAAEGRPSTCGSGTAKNRCRHRLGDDFWVCGGPQPDSHGESPSPFFTLTVYPAKWAGRRAACLMNVVRNSESPTIRA